MVTKKRPVSNKERRTSLLGHNSPAHSRLFGNALPVRVIPARLPVPEGSGVKPGSHKSFRDLVIDDSHEAWIDGIHIPDVHNQTLLHKHVGGGTQHVVVSSANLDALNAHLDSVKIWTRATPSKPAAGPRPIDLQEVVDDAVHEVTGSSVRMHLARPRYEKHVNYHHLLGADAAARVRQHAVDVLNAKLPELVHAKMIDKDDHKAIDAGWVIDHFLRSKAGPGSVDHGLEDHDGHAAWLQDRPGAVLTRLGPLPEGHDVAFSIRDIGTVGVGQTKSYWLAADQQREGYKPIENQCVRETVTVDDGDVNAYMRIDSVVHWKSLRIRGGHEADSGELYGKGTWSLMLYGNENSSVTFSGTWTKSELKLV